MRRLALLLALAGTVTAMPASAELWRLASDGGAAPDRMHYYVDIDSVRRNGDTVEYTTMTVYERISGDRDYDRSWIKRRGNCASMSSQMLVTSFYAKGKLLETDSTPDKWITHQDGSIAYGMLSAVCGKRAYRGNPTTDPIGLSRSQFGSYSAPSGVGPTSKTGH